MEIDEHVRAIEEHGVGLADAAERAGLDAAVPTCPEWVVRELIGHVGQVHRWATAFVSGGHTEPDVALEDVPADGELLAWFRQGHARLVDALKNAAPDLDAWSFLRASSPLAFWARRQAHETAIHRVDAESAAGPPLVVDPAFAVDGIDELMFGFYSRKRGRLVADPAVRLGIALTDAQPGDMWSIVVGPDAREVTRGSARGDCVITGPASDVYQFLWNRRDRSVVHVTGDTVVLDLWRDKAGISWS